MSTSTLKQIQENLQYPPLKKIDPNTQEVTHLVEDTPEHAFSQAAIPSILASFFRYVQAEEGAATFVNQWHPFNWLPVLFGEKREEAIQEISIYSGQTNEHTAVHMQAIANETVAVVLPLLPENASPNDVQNFFNNQKNEILLYLPPALHMGKLLKNNSIDDDSHKMEGIVSSLMHNIGTAFDTSKEEGENIE